MTSSTDKSTNPSACNKKGVKKSERQVMALKKRIVKTQETLKNLLEKLKTCETVSVEEVSTST